MSNEREPLLNDEFASERGRQYDDFTDALPAMTKEIHFLGGLLQGREFYENLIASGKLRVVEEVRGETNGTHEGKWLHCSGCNEVWSTNAYAYCPGCGNPIKRPSPADQVEKRG